MTKKQIAEREARNRDLAERDRRNRCPVCKVAVDPKAAFVRLGLDAIYCSPGCVIDAVEREEFSARRDAFPSS